MAWLVGSTAPIDLIFKDLRHLVVSSEFEMLQHSFVQARQNLVLGHVVFFRLVSAHDRLVSRLRLSTSTAQIAASVLRIRRGAGLMKWSLLATLLHIDFLQNG